MYLCVCVYVYVFVYVYVYLYVYASGCTYIHMNQYIFRYTHNIHKSVSHTHICGICVFTYVYTRLCIYVWTFVFSIPCEFVGGWLECAGHSRRSFFWDLPDREPAVCGICWIRGLGHNGPQKPST